MYENPGLAKQVMQDLIGPGKWPLTLLIMIVVTALSVVYFTHKTRLVVAMHDELRSEHAKLEVEMRNILLEEYTLSEHSRIETIAREKLNMIRPDNQHEKIVSQ